MHARPLRSDSAGALHFTILSCPSVINMPVKEGSSWRGYGCCWTQIISVNSSCPAPHETCTDVGWRTVRASLPAILCSSTACNVALSGHAHPLISLLIQHQWPGDGKPGHSANCQSSDRLMRPESLHCTGTVTSPVSWAHPHWTLTPSAHVVARRP